MASAPTPCEEFVYMAKLVEQVKHYEEMVEFMEKVFASTESEELTVDERNLLSKEDHLVVIRNYRSKIKVELSNIYDKILKLLDTHLVPSLTSGDSKVFYLKMKGAYHRYFTEFKIDANRKEAIMPNLLSQLWVVLVANSLPALNDVTPMELPDIVAEIAQKIDVENKILRRFKNCRGKLTLSTMVNSKTINNRRGNYKHKIEMATGWVRHGYDSRDKRDRTTLKDFKGHAT
ncbi:14-3-3-like protein [Glycine soja]